MPVFNPRSRVVSFRLSEEEYEGLLEICLSHGARSISDFARIATCRYLRGSAGDAPEPLSSLVRELKTEVTRLDSELKRLADMVYGK
jgi:hypothetical protein